MEGELTDLIARGRELYERGDLTRAEAMLSQALSKGASSYADVHHTLGVIYHSWGHFSKARAAFEEALRINPEYTEAALNLSITYNDLGRYTEAREVFQRAVPKNGESTDALTRAKIANLHAEVGDAYRSAGLSREAAVEYRRALALCPAFADIRTRLAQSLSEDGNGAEAIDQLRLALTDKPEYVPALLHLGLMLRAQGDVEGARDAFAKVLAVAPGHERAEAYLRML